MTKKYRFLCESLIIILIWFFNTANSWSQSAESDLTRDLGTIDAALRLSESRALFITNERLITFDIENDTIFLNSNENLSDIFQGLPFETIEAAEVIDSNRIMFFSGERMCYYNPILHETYSGYPKTIKEEWPDASLSTVDAAFKFDKESIYLSDGGQIYVLNLSDNRINPIQPNFLVKDINRELLLHQFPNLTGALNWNNEYSYIFSKSDFIKNNNLGLGITGNKKHVGDNWQELLTELSQNIKIINVDNLNLLTLDTFSKTIQLLNYTQVLNDYNNEYSFEDIQDSGLSNSFTNYNEWIASKESLTTSTQCAWAKFEIKNNTDQSQNIALYSSTFLYVDSAHIYIRNENDSLSILKLGKYMPVSKKNMGDVPDHPRFKRGTSIFFPLERNARLRIYIKYFSTIDFEKGLTLSLYYVNLSPKTKSLASSMMSETKYVNNRLFLQGLFWMLALFCLITFGLRRDQSSIALCLYIMAVSYLCAIHSYLISALYFNSILFPEIPHFTKFLTPIIAGVSIASIAFFTQSFLKSTSPSRGVDILLKLLLYLGLGFTVFSVLTAIFNIIFATEVWRYIIISGLILYLLLIPFLLRKRSALTNIILLGIILIVILMLPMQLIIMFGSGELASKIVFMTNGSMLYFAVIGQVFIYTLGLGYRDKIIEIEKLKYEELDKVKSRFFTNIAHEFRTPLTLILGPLEKIKIKLSEIEDLNLVGLVQDNAKILLKLVNQILDLSKLESKNVRLQTSKIDIVSFLKGIFYSFESLAYQKNIIQEFNSSVSSLDVFIDQYKLETIFSNLLSNAFKFSNNGDTISLSLEKKSDHFEVTLKDTGSGIHPDHLPRIFDRFYQVDGGISSDNQGSGVGLALVKELVLLHKGTITADSKLGKGSTFIISFPLGKEHLLQSEILDPESQGRIQLEHEQKDERGKLIDPVAGENEEGSLKEHTILIIEDHKDVRLFIRSQLNQKSEVIEAEDGIVGIEKATTYVPDLIICDVMMPYKNGYEVCNHLKNDIRTSHIPIILLTAKAERQEKIEGLESGADDYLIKPFDTKELQIRVKNLIDLRTRLRTRFSESIQIKPSEVSVNSMDQEFMQKALSAVEKHMSNEDFNVDLMTKEMNMSPTQLNRKMRSLIDQSTNQFIKSVRLQRAAELLKKDTGTVAEIAFMTGFRSSAYFISTFKNKFGVSPGAYKDSLQI